MKIVQLLTLGTLLVFLASCKKEGEKLPQPDADGYIWLRNVQSLPLIKQTIRGDWKIHYAYGGLTGRQKTVLNNSWFRYLPNDSLYIVIDNSQYATAKTSFVHKKTEFGFNAWILDSNYELVIDLIKKDSLWLTQNNPDPVSYVMTKIK